MTDSTAMETSSVRNSPRLSPMLGRLRSAVLATLATSRTLLTTATQRWLVRVARLCGHSYFAQPSVCLCLTIVANMCQRGQNKIIVFRFSEIIQLRCICSKQMDIYCRYYQETSNCEQSSSICLIYFGIFICLAVVMEIAHAKAARNMNLMVVTVRVA